MKGLSLCLITLTLIALIFCPATRAGVKYVAVVETDIDAASGVSAKMTPAEVRLITGEIRREAVNNLPRTKYNVMTTETVMAQGSALLSECSDENCVITLGSKIGADYIVRGTISKFQTLFTLTVDIYETSDGNLVVSSDPVRSENIRGLLENAGAVCANMYKRFVNQDPMSSATPAAEPPPPVAAVKTYTLSTNVSPMVDPNSIDMIYVGGGTFTMGCTSEQGSDCGSDEKPAHSVTLSSYYIGKYEVTQGLWKAVMGSLPPSLTSPSSYGYGDNYPVYYVSWNDIAGKDGFIDKLNNMTGKKYRLPTEAEWEYAARVPYSHKYFGDVAWYDRNSGNATHIVGTKAPNELGIYDMSGNVWEWVSDWYGSGYYSSSPSTNPTGPQSGFSRVIRGGGWISDARRYRVSYRYAYVSDFRRNDLGFRLVLSP